MTSPLKKKKIFYSVEVFLPNRKVWYPIPIGNPFTTLKDAKKAALGSVWAYKNEAALRVRIMKVVSVATFVGAWGKR